MDAGAVGLSVTYACKSLILPVFCHGHSIITRYMLKQMLTEAVQFTDYVLWIVRMYAAAEMTMNSVERVGECE